MIETVFLAKSEVMTVVPDYIEDKFNIDKERISDQLKPIMDILVDNLVCYFEYPYVERYYRDSYYSYFSKKHNSSNRDSVRISIFYDSLEPSQFFTCNNIDNFYLGFITIRPTTYRLIGHSFLSPKALKNQNFTVMLYFNLSSIDCRR